MYTFQNNAASQIPGINLGDTLGVSFAPGNNSWTYLASLVKVGNTTQSNNVSIYQFNMPAGPAFFLFSFPVVGAVSTTFFTLGDQLYLGVAGTKSSIYKYTDSGVTLLQSFPYPDVTSSPLRH